jgi:hypothetical protein
MFFIGRGPSLIVAVMFMAGLIAGVHLPSVCAHSFTALVMYFTLKISWQIQE